MPTRNAVFLRTWSTIACLTLAACSGAPDGRVSVDPARPTYATLTGPTSQASMSVLRTWMDAHRGQPLHLTLRSGGGDAFSAMDASRMMQARGDVDTDVPPGVRCASACTFLWLAGHRRTLEPTAQLAFHGAQCARCAGDEVARVDDFEHHEVVADPRVAILVAQLHGLEQHGQGHGTVVQSDDDGGMVAWDESDVSAWMASHGQGPKPGLWAVDAQGVLSQADLGRCAGC